MTALGGFFFCQRGFFEPELAHQGAFLGTRHFHPKWFDLDLGFALVSRHFDLGLALQIRFDVRKILFWHGQLFDLGLVRLADWLALEHVNRLDCSFRRRLGGRTVNRARGFGRDDGLYSLNGSALLRGHAIPRMVMGFAGFGLRPDRRGGTVNLDAEQAIYKADTHFQVPRIGRIDKPTRDREKA